MRLTFWPSLLLFASLATANNSGSVPQHFVSTQGEQFHVNGSEFRWIGTNAYWLSSLNTEEDIVNTLSNMSAAGISVVKTWGFNDVEIVPVNGTWFQLIANGTTTINNGTNGLQKLDLVVKHAQRFGIYVILSLTNNWNPRPLFDNITTSIEDLGEAVHSRQLWGRDMTTGTNNTLPRNFLSNDYGGMDVYVRQFGLNDHDEFYTNETLIESFKNYTTAIVSRYANSSAIFSWEIANDPRCNSTVAASQNCDTTTVTRWHSTIAQHIQSVDPNHLISSGNQGFFCLDGCPKLFQRTEPPPPQPSMEVNSRRRSLPRPLTKERILTERREQWKKSRAALLASGYQEEAEGVRVRIRGRWMSTPTRRQADVGVGVGSAFDGSHGVDSQDILSIQQIGFSSFQLFPDQNSYGVPDPSLPIFNNTVQQGIEWIQRQAEAAAILQKPVALTGFGLVTQANAPAFVPFNSSVAPFANQTSSSIQPFGFTDSQRDDAYSQWVNTGILNGLNGIMQYQWGQSNLTTQPGTTISPNIQGSTESPNIIQAGQSPNDGYSSNGVGQEQVQGILFNASQEIGD